MTTTEEAIDQIRALKPGPMPMSLGHLTPLLQPPRIPIELMRDCMTEIRLYGRLRRKFGARYRISIRNPREAVHAIDVLKPGFRKEILRMKDYDFAVRVGTRHISEHLLDFGHDGRSIAIRPVARGSSNTKGILTVIAGVVLVVVGALLYAYGGALAVKIGASLITAGIGVALSGISALIAGTPGADNSGNQKNKPSYQFGGAVNIAAQGVPYALPYGRVFTGSVVGSSGIEAKDVTSGSSDGIPGGGDSAGSGGIPPGWGNDEKNLPHSFTGLRLPARFRGERDAPLFARGSGGQTMAQGSHGGMMASGRGGSSSGGHTLVEDKDTLQSTQIARILDIIGEGPIRGLVNGMQSVYLNDTPAMNADGTSTSANCHTQSGSKAVSSPTRQILKEHAGRAISGTNIPLGAIINTVTYNDDGSSTANISIAATGTATTVVCAIGGSTNFKDFTFEFRNGTQDQTYITGFDANEATTTLSRQLKVSTGPWIQHFDNPNLDAVRVIVDFPKLEKQDKNDGDIHGGSVRLKIELDTSGTGLAYTTIIDDTVTGKASSAYDRSYLIPIPAASQPGPWNIKATRITDDSTSQLVSNDTFITSFTEIVYAKLRHPLTALSAMTFDAQNFGSIPTRTFHIDGLLISIPSNYNPDTRVYTGSWDGTFVTNWTCNPAWVLWDIISNNRYGLGKYLPAAMLDKFAFYAAAQHCDELVPDGFGGMERRYECHAYIADRRDAFQVISDVAGIFQAAAAYISGVIIPVVDRFVDPSLYSSHFNPTSVDDFNFSTISRKTQNTAVLVEWNDPTDQGRPKTEYVEDPDEINRIGFRQTRVAAFGCYSRGQAHRRGRWMLLTEKVRGEALSFRTGMEGATLLPGDVSEISTSFRAGKVLYGRVLAETLTTITMDRAIQLLAGKTYVLTLYLANGTMFDATVATGAGTWTTLTLTATLPSACVDGSTFTLNEGTLVPEPYRILGVKLLDKLRTEVTAIAYVPSLYDAVDQDSPLGGLPPSNLPPVSFCSPAEPPMTVTPRTIASPSGGVQQVLQVVWHASLDKFLRDYRLSYRYNQGNWVDMPNTSGTTVDIPVGPFGTYDIQVIAFNALGAPSQPLATSYYLGVANPVTGMSITGLELSGQANSTIFQQRDAKFDWRLNSPSMEQETAGEDPSSGMADGIDDPMFQSFHVTFWKDDKQFWPASGAFYPKDPVFTFTEEMNLEGMRAIFGATSRATPTFRIEVRALDVFNKLSDPATLTVTNPPPATPVNFLAISSFKAAFLTWDRPPDADLAAIEIWRSDTTNDFTAATKKADASPNATAFTDDTLIAGDTYYYFLRSRDTFGNFSAPTAGASLIAGSVAATDITDFPELGTSIFPNTVVLWGDMWTDNSPSGPPAGIAWNAHSVWHEGDEHPVAAGTTTLKYVYWRASSPSAYQTSADNPVDVVAGWSNNDDFQIAINQNGTHELAWYGFANAVIGSAYIKDAAITSAKIALLAVDDARIVNAGISKLAAGSVTADTIQVGLGLAVLNPNPSFEQASSGWTLFNGAVTAGTIGGASAIDGLSHLYCADVASNGAKTAIKIPVNPSQQISLGAWVRTGDPTITVLLGLQQFKADGTNSASPFVWLLNGTGTTLGLPTGVWTYREGILTTAADCFQVIILAQNGAVAATGFHLRFDNVTLQNVVNGGRITAGSIQSQNYIPGSQGGIFQLDNGFIEASDGVFRRSLIVDGIRVSTLSTPTFKNDFTGLAMTNMGYDDITPLSVRVQAPTGIKVRFETNKTVTPASPFWPALTGGGDGTGTNMVGFIQSDGSGPDQVIVGGPPSGPNKFTTAWHVALVSASDPTIIGNEVIITSTYVPVDQTLWPKVEKPYIYVDTADGNGVRGTDTTYIVRANCTDATAILEQSFNGSTWSAYTRGAILKNHLGTLVGLDKGENVYVRARRYVSSLGWQHFRDSDTAVFANTTGAIPVTTGNGTPGTDNPTKQQP